MKHFLPLIAFLVLSTCPSTFAQDSQPELDEFIYDPIGRRDPFKPWRVFTPRKVAEPSDTSPSKVVEITDPLLKYDLERYTILGIMWDVGNPRALVRDPEGKSHLVYKNSRIGRNEGYVQSVREGELVVIERIEVDGQPKTMTKLLAVRIKEAGAAGQ